MIWYLLTVFGILAFLLGATSQIVRTQRSLLLWDEQAVYQAAIDLADEFQDRNGVAILGDSRARAALNPSWLHPGSRNLALGGGTPLEGYYILKRLLANGVAPRSLLVSYAPFHLMHMDTFWKRGLKYGLFGLGDLQEISLELLRSPEPATWGDADFSFFFGRKLPFSLRVLDLGLLYVGFAPYFQAESLLVWSGQAAVPENMSYMAHRERLGWLPLPEVTERWGTEELSISSFKASGVIEGYLLKTLELARARGIHVTWTTMPLDEATRTRLKPSFISQYQEYLRGLAQRFPEFEIETELMFMPTRFFSHSSHVVPEGAREVSSRIVRLGRLSGRPH